MHFTASVVVYGLVMLSAGCSSRPMGPTKLQPVSEWLNSQYLGDQLKPNSRAAIIARNDVFLAYEDARNPEDVRRAARNRIISGLLAADDYDFQDYAAKSTFAQRATATGADFLVLGLTAAATIAGGEQAKTALAGVATAIAGGRIAVDKEIFYDTTLPMLVSRMQKMRTEKRAAIQKQLLARGVADYPLESALSDVMDYYRAGTLAAAVSDIEEDTARRGDRTTASAGIDQLPAEILSMPRTLTVPSNDSLNKLQFQVVEVSWATAEHNVLNLKLTVAGNPPDTRTANAHDVELAFRNSVNTGYSVLWGGPLLSNADIRDAFNHAQIVIDPSTPNITFPTAGTPSVDGSTSGPR